MKKFLRPLVLSIIYCLTSNICSAQFTLTVTNGYGSGTYSTGDTIDIWSAAIPQTSSFAQWTGNISTLESSDEWHTTLVMPAQNISVTANFKTIGTININYEKIMGRDTIKNVYSYFPQNFKGIIFCFHGTGGAAANWVSLLEYKQFLNDAIADTFGFIITEAEEITKQTDFDMNGKLRWATYPIDTTTNVDYVNIKILMDTFRLRGITNNTTKYYAVGMSNGGNFSPAIATAFGWKAAVSYCAQSAQVLMNTTTIPVQWCMAKYDNNDNVGAAGNAAALVNSQTLEARGICTKYFSHNHSPVYASRFMRSGTITPTQANNFFAEMQTNNLLDANNYLRFASDTIAARIAATPSAYPIFFSLNGFQRLFVATQVDAMYAAHQFFSDYDKKTLRFFDSLCDTTATPTAIEDFRNEILDFRVNPNPTNGDLNIYIPEEIIGEEISVFDLSGRKILSEMAVQSNVLCLKSKISSGIYFVKIGNIAKKFVRE